MTDAASLCRWQAFAFAEEVDRLCEVDEIVSRFQRVVRNVGLNGLTIGGLSTHENFEDLVLARGPARGVAQTLRRGALLPPSISHILSCIHGSVLVIVGLWRRGGAGKGAVHVG